MENLSTPFSEEKKVAGIYMNANWINNIEKVNETISKIPLRWIAEPEEIARFVRVILEDFSDYATGVFLI